MRDRIVPLELFAGRCDRLLYGEFIGFENTHDHYIYFLKKFINMSYRHNKPDIQDKYDNYSGVNYHSVKLPMITEEEMENRKKEREDPGNITTRRLTSIYMSKMMKLNQNWCPNFENVYKCYEYINEIVVHIEQKDQDIINEFCVGTDYCDYFLTTDPDVIKRIINEELNYYATLWHSKHP